MRSRKRQQEHSATRNGAAAQDRFAAKRLRKMSVTGCKIGFREVGSDENAKRNWGVQQRVDFVRMDNGQIFYRVFGRDLSLRDLPQCRALLEKVAARSISLPPDLIYTSVAAKEKAGYIIAVPPSSHAVTLHEGMREEQDLNALAADLGLSFKEAPALVRAVGGVVGGAKKPRRCEPRGLRLRLSW